MDGGHAEIAEFLRSLLEHSRKCDADDCGHCGTLRGILGDIRSRLFASSGYPAATEFRGKFARILSDVIPGNGPGGPDTGGFRGSWE